MTSFEFEHDNVTYEVMVGEMMWQALVHTAALADARLYLHQLDCPQCDFARKAIASFTNKVADGLNEGKDFNALVREEEGG